MNKRKNKLCAFKAVSIHSKYVWGALFLWNRGQGQTRSRSTVQSKNDFFFFFLQFTNITLSFTYTDFTKFSQYQVTSYSFIISRDEQEPGWNIKKQSLVNMDYPHSDDVYQLMSPNYRVNHHLCLMVLKRPGQCGSVDWALACELNGRWFNSQSGSMPGLQARFPVGGT